MKARISKVAALGLWKIYCRSISPPAIDCLLTPVIMLRGGESRSEVVIGGGDINEKKRSKKDKEKWDATEKTSSSKFQPSRHRSHLFHALEGLDRYPNYINRWSSSGEDVARLEAALIEQLEKVRDQGRKLELRKQKYESVREKLLSRDNSWESMLNPPTSWKQVFDEILSPDAAKVVCKSLGRQGGLPPLEMVISGDIDMELDAGQLEVLLEEEEEFGVYSFPLLSEKICTRLRGYVRATSLIAEEEGLEASPSLDLDIAGLAWLNSLLFHLIVKPISRHLFSETETGRKDLDWRHGYVASYSASPSQSKPRQRLVPHTDDSEVTLNVCIGDVDFEGGLLQFSGLRGTPEAGRATTEPYQPQVGRAVLHAGRHLHEVTQVTKGDRYAYIMWTRSWAGTRAEACPCCWLNRRDGNTCICRPIWN